jgi:hypothetical protein
MAAAVSCILNGFKKAEIYPYDDNTVDSDVESSDNDEPLSNIDTRIAPDLVFGENHRHVASH